MKVLIALALLAIVAVNAQITHTFTYGNGKGQFYNGRTKKTSSAYSGDQAHYNKQQFQNLRAKGPLPVGKWQVIASYARHPHLGTYAHHLGPVAVAKQYGRSGFFIHGDNRRNNHTASQGCIIVDNESRMNVKKGDIVIVKLF
eukprot:TRINITY_DN0_c602_g1_i3.p2 TRINITY_DN0_c602_g1~~TRINITY_DN0_c602_g1_i3.p2  ORF type:complete len:143 (+),score=35.86 TRINITY_DN0_c602_g1_i3:44-472(+)